MYTSGGVLKASDWILFIKFHFQCPCSNSGDIFGVLIIKSLLYSCLETCSCFTNKQPDALSFSYLVPLLSFVLISIDMKKIFLSLRSKIVLCCSILSTHHETMVRWSLRKTKGTKIGLFSAFSCLTSKESNRIGCSNIKMVEEKRTLKQFLSQVNFLCCKVFWLLNSSFNVWITIVLKGQSNLRSI